MKTIKGILGLAAAAVFSTACESNEGTVIEGTATNADQLVFMEVGGEAPDTVATVDLASGEEFSQQLQIDSLTMVLVSAGERYRVPLFVQKGENVELDIDAAEENPSYTVSGSPESERIKEITTILDKTMDKVDSLNTVAEEAKGTEGFAQKRMQLDSTFENIVDEADAEYKAMIDEEPGSIANVFIFSQALGNFRILSPEEDFEYFQKVSEGIQETYPNSAITKNFVKSINQLEKQMAQSKQMEEVQKNVSVGTPVPDIALQNPEGETMRLSDLRGNVVLVDFWAAWCRPCRMENPNLVRLYDKYKDRGFEIFSVSLDGLPNQQNPKDAWVNAIQQDNLTWDTHVSDLKGWNSSVVPKFGIRGIPYTVLVDREGNIIDTKLRGPQLEAKLKEMLAES